MPQSAKRHTWAVLTATHTPGGRNKLLTFDLSTEVAIVNGMLEIASSAILLSTGRRARHRKGSSAVEGTGGICCGLGHAARMPQVGRPGLLYGTSPGTNEQERAHLDTTGRVQQESCVEHPQHGSSGHTEKPAGEEHSLPARAWVLWIAVLVTEPCPTFRIRVSRGGLFPPPFMEELSMAVDVR